MGGGGGGSGVITLATALVLTSTPSTSKVYGKSRTTKSPHSSYSSTVSATSTGSTSYSISHEREPQTQSNPQVVQNFRYSRASPSVRWPHLKISDNGLPSSPRRDDGDADFGSFTATSSSSVADAGEEMERGTDAKVESGPRLEKPSRIRMKKINKLVLKRARDWRLRVQSVVDKILGLGKDDFVGDVLDDTNGVQMTTIDYCLAVKRIGQENWQRALEVYEWLNLRRWYSPNPRMLATILAVLGKAGQEALAAEIFARGTLDNADGDAATTVQVYNAMMGVYSRSGNFLKVQKVFDLMRDRSCEPDLVSFNTLIHARLKAADGISPNLTVQLLDEVRKFGLRPDIITYNTLLSACSRDSNLEEAIKVFNDMEAFRCEPDLWTYNTMISVCARCELSTKAEQLFHQLEAKGFFPDAVTHNSLLYAFARQGNVEKVKEIGDRMVRMGFAKDEMTYNTIIHMYAKQGQYTLALQLYRDMKSSCGRNPDTVTYTVLIDSLGKANKMAEAAAVMSDMLAAGVKPNLRTYSALICGYNMAGETAQAQETFDCMRKSGIIPDKIAYSIMVNVFLKGNETNKAMVLCREMVRDGMTPDLGVYEAILRALGRENKVEDIDRVVRDMEELCGMKLEAICSILVKVECYDAASKILRKTMGNCCEIENKDLLPILNSYSSSGKYSEALDLLQFLKQHAPGSNQLVNEFLVTVLCKTHQVDAALKEYSNIRDFGSSGSCSMFESLIQGCERDELVTEASQVFSDMRFYGIKPSEFVYRSMVHVFCKMSFPETAHHLIDSARTEGIFLNDVSVLVAVIETYGKLKIWKKAEDMVGDLRQMHVTLDRKVWNALIKAYAESGCYERARAVFNTMMRNGPPPTVDSMNGLLQALIADKRLDELYVVIEELQDMGFKISKCSIILMIEAFARKGDIFEVKKLYHGMKAAGYFPTMHLYRVIIGLLSRGKQVRDVEAMVSEMEETGLKPDISIRNSMLRMYYDINDFRKTTQVYHQIKEDGLEADEDTYNTIILMYCNDYRPEEGMSMMHEMRRAGLEPKLDTYKSLIAAFAKQQLVEQAEQLFEELLSKGCKLDRSFYHIMMKMFRSSGNYLKAENLLSMMKNAGLEPTAATAHILMVSYGSSGQPQEAEKVLSNFKSSCSKSRGLLYGSVIDAFLKNGDYEGGIQKLTEMKREGVVLNHIIWTCFIRGASLCQHASEAFALLNALQDEGFNLPIRLLTEKSETLVSDVDHCLEMLETEEDDAALNFVNALEDLLWAFELRATASWIFQLAIKRKIYRHDVFRVADNDWGADFRKLSGGAALVGLTLWLDYMQDASLEGYPSSPKSVALVSGVSEYNMVSLSSTLKACLWEMGSPFFPCRTRSGLLVAKAHSLRMWLKDSPFCLDLELKDAPSLPKLNSMQLIEGCFMRRGLVPAFKEITEKLGYVRPKKFAKLALLSDDIREKAIQVYIDGGREREEKKRSKAMLIRKKKTTKLRRRRFFRKALQSKPEK